MSNPEFVSTDDVTGLKLYVLAVDRPEDVPDKVVLDSPFFVCLIAWDAIQASPETVYQLACKLLNSGVVRISTWGVDCERVHDLFDETIVESNLAKDDDTLVMTDWHNDEPLSKAIWFVLHAAWPAERYFDQCNAILGLSIGSPAAAADIRSAFSDSDAFTDKILDSQEHGRGD
jgi:hypothetical protein